MTKCSEEHKSILYRVLSKYNDKELTDDILRSDAEGNTVSIGSSFHGCDCKPCVLFSRNGFCPWGIRCMYCHFQGHPLHTFPKKVGKKKRAILKILPDIHMVKEQQVMDTMVKKGLVGKSLGVRPTKRKTEEFVEEQNY